MSLKLYMDAHIPRVITDGLRAHGIDVLTDQEDGADELSDPDLLDRATALARVLFSEDKDLLREAAWRQRSAEPFAGLFYTHQFKLRFGPCIDDLALFAQVCEPEEFANRVEYMP